jgi:D-glycero-beta-D-manno-heptose-7-phosphate kinase
MNDLLAVIDKFKSKRVLVIGDLLLDRYIWGDVSRISPEAPVPVLHVSRETYTAGGAANVALNLAALGVRTEVIGALGRDQAGEELVTLLSDAGIESKRCHYDQKRMTIVKTRVVARNQQLCRIDKEGMRSSYEIFGDGLSHDSLIVEAAREADAIIVSDYAKGVVGEALFNQLSTECKKAGKILAVDPKPSRKLDLRGAGLMTPNRNEALEMADIQGLSPFDEFPLEDIVSRIHQKYAPEVLVVTLGADGMAVAKNGKIIRVLPTQAREVFDVSGAGDTVIATLTAAMCTGADPVNAAILANYAAGIVVSKMGTAVVTKDELANLTFHLND